MTPPTKSPHRWRQWLRDAFLLALSLIILYDQVFIASTAQPVLIFLVIFLWGCIPALRGDQKPGHYSLFARLVMHLMGITFPENWRDVDDGDMPSGGDSRTSSGGRQSAGPPPSSRR